ncbi:hypothetical protein Aau02nite_09020 [Amorphoplanes auranticolor]|uniref:Uncharacterized protein n=1 Tax=Actinoplanes auranticolor TaxID=47988 RepID=A0A919S3T7_9ACTN|nr:hypothetical protein Aau02nite_09020 [Actinoplanes auranticolor]
MEGRRRAQSPDMLAADSGPSGVALLYPLLGFRKPADPDPTPAARSFDPSAGPLSPKPTSPGPLCCGTGDLNLCRGARQLERHLYGAAR